MTSLRAPNAQRLRKLPTAKNETPTALSRELGDCVYAVRTPDRLVKIGFTSDLDRRIRQFGCKWTDVLLAKAGSYDDEALLHKRFAPYLARGNEYYFPAIEVMQWVNEERARMGISAASK